MFLIFTYLKYHISEHYSALRRDPLFIRAEIQVCLWGFVLGVKEVPMGYGLYDSISMIVLESQNFRNVDPVSGDQQ